MVLSEKMVQVRQLLSALYLVLQIQHQVDFEFFGGMDSYKARAKIGNLIESPAIYPNMTGKQNLTIFCKMLGINEDLIPELLNLVGLSDVGKKKARDYSLGMSKDLV